MREREDGQEFFLVWGSGSCNDGSCTGVNLERFGNLAEAGERADYLRKRHDTDVTVIRGVMVQVK